MLVNTSTLPVIVSRLQESEEDEPKSPTSKATLEEKLKNMYENVDDEDLAKYLRNRWQAFVSFRRFVRLSVEGTGDQLFEKHKLSWVEKTTMLGRETRRFVFRVDMSDALGYNLRISARCRMGASGDVVMKGGHGFVADYLPGEYTLVDLACFTDLPPLEPAHVVVKVRTRDLI